MRSVVSGLLLASIVLLAACSGSKAPEAPAAPIVFAVPLKPNTNGMLEPRSGRITVGTGPNAYSADVALSPSWWVTADGFKIVWFAGLSQTTRYFQISGETPGEAARPKLLKSPEEAVREVRVAFDGAPPVRVLPEATRAVFKPPAGAKAVTSVEITFGPADAPVAYTWK
jgi:hypothetical protein